MPYSKLLRISRRPCRAARHEYRSPAASAKGHAHPMNCRTHAVAAPYVFDGEKLHRDAAVVVDGAHIAAVVPRAAVPAATPLRELPGHVWLTPGFVDIQVNGGGYALFNDAPTPETIRTIIAAHRR